jgi:hypothetical protein
MLRSLAMAATDPSVITRWETQPAPTSDTDRLMRLLFDDDEQVVR